MNELVLPPSELTPRAVSSTLNIASIMDPTPPIQPQPEQTPEQAAIQANEEHINRGMQQLMREGRAQNMAEARRMMEERIHNEREGRRSRGGADGAGSQGPNSIAEEGVNDQEFKNILNVYNREVAQGVFKKGQEELTLSHIADFRKRLTDRMQSPDFPETDRDAAYSKLASLNEEEVALHLEASGSGKLGERGKEQSALYNAIEKFKRDYHHEIEQERQGLPLGPRAAEFKSIRQHLVESVHAEIEVSPSIEAGRFPAIVMAMAAEFRETREGLINEILFKSYEDQTEQDHYEINFFAGGNLDELMSILLRKSKGVSEGFEPSDREREIYLWYKSLKTSARNFYEMNKAVGAGDLEGFSRIATGINYPQLEGVQKVSGVAEVMRLYEQKLFEIMSKRKRIDSDGFKEVKAEVRRAFMDMNKRGLVTSSYNEVRGFDGPDGALKNRQLSDWELERALNVGKVMYNITFRASEIISIGQIESGDKRYASYPQEAASRIMNPLLWTADRFEIAAHGGGTEYLKMVKEKYFQFLKDKGRHLGHNKITELGGMKVEDVEFASMLGISGILSGWRMTTMSWEAIKFGPNNENNLWAWLRNPITEGENEGKKREDIIKAIREDKTKSAAQKSKEIYEEFKPLIQNMDIGLGVLMRALQGNSGSGGLLSEEYGYETRKAIWEKVSEVNIPMMMNFLGKLKMEGDGNKEAVDRVRELRKSIGGLEYWDQKDEGSELTRWELFQNKIAAQHEIRVKKRTSPEGYYAQAEQEAAFTESERNERMLVEGITNEGKKIAPHIADIIFPYMTFMNDMPFEGFKWSGPGEEFYRRRLGDIGSYSKAGQAFTAIMDNPAFLKHDKAPEAFKEIQRGIESPNGDTAGQEAVLSSVYAWMDLVTTKGMAKQASIGEFLRNAQKPVSRAQELVGVEAEALNEKQLFHILHQLEGLRVVNHDTFAYIQKKKRLGLIWRLLAIARDAAIVAPLSAVGTTFRQSTKQSL